MAFQGASTLEVVELPFNHGHGLEKFLMVEAKVWYFLVFFKNWSDKVENFLLISIDLAAINSLNEFFH